MRPACVDKNGVKKGAWSEEEDNKLRAYILRYGHWNWRLLPKFAGLNRCGKSCRLRWLNYLKPGVIRGNYTKEEEDLIAKLHDELGNKWSAIAAKLPGRTDNEIKNYWHTHLKKRSKRSSKQPTKPFILSENPTQNTCQITEKASSSPSSSEIWRKAVKNNLGSSDIHILESSRSDNSWNNPGGVVNCDSDDSASSSSGEKMCSILSELEPVLSGTSSGSFGGFDQECFWSEPFQVDMSACYGQDQSFSEPLDEGDFFSSYLFHLR